MTTTPNTETFWRDIETSKGLVRVQVVGIDELTGGVRLLVDYGAERFRGRDGHSGGYALKVHGTREGYQHVTLANGGEIQFGYGTDWPTLSRASQNTIEQAIRSAVQTYAVKHTVLIDTREALARTGANEELKGQADLLRRMADELDTQAKRAIEGLTYTNRPFDTEAKTGNSGLTLRGFTMPNEYDIERHIDAVREREWQDYQRKYQGGER